MPDNPTAEGRTLSRCSRCGEPGDHIEHISENQWRWTCQEPASGRTTSFETERERVLTETLIEARDQLVELADAVREIDERPTYYAFGDLPWAGDDAWEMWEAMVQDAEDRGEGHALAREVNLLHVRWGAA